MLTQEKYDIIIKTIEDAALSRPIDFFVPQIDANMLSEEAFSASGCPNLENRVKNSILNFMTGKTCKQYIDYRVLMHAYEVLLTQETYNEDALMNITGFSDSSSLFRKFRDVFGISPKEAFERKDTSLYVPPTYWNKLSANQQEVFTKTIEVEVIKEIPVALIKEVVRVDRRPYKVVGALFLVIALLIAGFLYCFPRIVMDNDYVAFDLVIENGNTISKLENNVTYSITPLKKEIIISDGSGSRTLTDMKVKRKGLYWTDHDTDITYVGILYSDKSIICYEYQNGEQLSDQLRLVSKSEFEKWQDSWDGYYDVYIEENGYSSQNGYSVQISLEGSLFIMSSLSDEEPFISFLSYCGSEHLIFTIPELTEEPLQCNLTGEDTFTVSVLNSNEVLFKCYKVMDGDFDTDINKLIQ